MPSYDWFSVLTFGLALGLALGFSKQVNVSVVVGLGRAIVVCQH